MNVLGITGLDIIDAGGLVGFGAGGINAIGAWGTVDLGLTTTVNFTIVVNPAQGQFAWDAHVVELSFESVFQIVSKLTNQNLGFPAAVVSVLSSIVIDYLDITVCPTAFSIGGRDISAGFLVNGSISFLGATVELLGGVVDKPVLIQGVPVTLKDLIMGFGVFNLNVLAPVLPLIDFANYIMPYVQDLLNSMDQVCLPQVCELDVCTPGACADTPLKSEVDSVVSTLRQTVDSLLTVTRAEVSQVSVWDLLNGGGPLLQVDTMVAGRVFTASYQVTTNFFIQTQLSTVAYQAVAAGAALSLNLGKAGVVAAILSNSCNMIDPTLCHDFGSLGSACLPSVC